MLLDFLKPLTGQPGPFVTVTLDVSADDPPGVGRLPERWRAQRDSLVREGVPETTLTQLDERAAEGRRHEECTRVVCATPDQVVLDIVVPGRAPRDESSYSPLPHLSSLVRLLSRAQPYALVHVGRTGSDITLVGLTDRGGPGNSRDSRDVVRRVPGGGWWLHRFRSRPGPSWDHHARAVAQELDTIAERRKPELILLDGEDDAVADVIEMLGPDAVARSIRLGLEETGTTTTEDEAGDASLTNRSRTAGRRQAVADALQRHREDVHGQLVSEFTRRVTGQVAPAATVEGLEDVVDALQRGRVEHLLMHERMDEDPAAPSQLWVDRPSIAIGTTEADVSVENAGTAQRDRADAVLIWSLARSDIPLTFLEAGDPRPRDGVGALLRW
jgi:Bacterial archaeo-eukaryotic release factor family 2